MRRSIRPSRLSALVAPAIVTLAVACGGSGRDPVVPNGPTPRSVVVSPDSLNLGTAESRQLTATVLDADGAQLTGTSVSFTAADSTVARVTAGGLVTARAVGKTTVAAKAGSATKFVPVVVRHLPASSVVGRVDLAGCPYGVAVSPNGVAYVSQICGSATTRIALSPTFAAGAGVPTPSQPAHVAVNPAGTTAYTANQAGRSVSIIDVASNTVVKTIPFGHDGFNVFVSADGATVYVTTADDVMYVLDAARRTITDSVRVGAQANGLAFDPTKPLIYVSSIAAGTITAIDTRTHAVTRTYALGSIPQRVAVSPDGTELFAADVAQGLMVLNLATGVAQHVDVGGSGIGLAMDREGDFVYVSVPFAGQVVVVSRTTHAVVGTIRTGGDPRNIAVAPDGSLLVANQSGWVDLLR